MTGLCVVVGGAGVVWLLVVICVGCRVVVVMLEMVVGMAVVMPLASVERVVVAVTAV